MKVSRISRSLTVLAVLSSATAMTLVNAAPAQAACHWKVTWQTAGVYEDPDMIWLLKNKYLGNIVGPYCDKVWNGSYWMTAVYCDCAWDGVGWMRSAALNPA